MTRHRKRRYLALIVFLFCLVLIGLVAFQMWYSLRYEQALRYAEQIIEAEPPAVCPGESFSFAVNISIERGNTVGRVTEGWCRADGICPRSLQNAPEYYNFLAPEELHATGKRVAPDVAAGRWQLRHCNETHATGLIDVTCYGVNIEIKDCGQ